VTIRKDGQSGLLGFSDRSYRLLALAVPPFFVIQTLVLAAMRFRMGTSTLAIQLVGLGFMWVYSVYHVLGPQQYAKAFAEVIR